MKKSSTDVKVKKTLVRHCEQKIREPLQPRVVRDLEIKPNSSGTIQSSVAQKENELSEPTLCSSVALANYLNDVKRSLPRPLSAEDHYIDKAKATAKMTKKLNFQFNDRIYNNLIELNANIEESRTKKDKRSSRTSVKRDIEPNIEDFFEHKIEKDSAPEVILIKPMFKPLRKVEEGSLHALVASFEDL
ncbi:hypothetical protein JYU34_001983 [Plutella xylostella]|uniref:Protein phosphatase 1 regulatory subunit 35 C-terminal domain-containing protein n=1 Tax=Plutella xylostella TaxID=51655 RepID=A0ABQ7R593_PLUXY|nr:hypothetical protein JYU34_001983 [Plutella xylostella]